MTNNRFDPPLSKGVSKLGRPVETTRQEPAPPMGSGSVVPSEPHQKNSGRKPGETVTPPGVPPYQGQPMPPLTVDLLGADIGVGTQVAGYSKEGFPSESAEETAPEPAQIIQLPRKRFKGKQLFWALFRLLLFGASTGTAIVGFIWLTQVPPAPDCQQQMSILASDEDKLYCAQQAAVKGDLKQLVAGMKLVKSWPKEDPRYAQAQQLLKQWSNQVLLTARYQASRNNLKQAIATAQYIPANSPVYQEAQATIAAWKKSQDKGSDYHDKFVEALRSQKWPVAADQIKILSRTQGSQWRNRVAELQAQLAAEREAWEKLQSARYLADIGTPDLLGEAIAQTQTISRQRFIRQEAQADIVRWSRSLLEVAAIQLQEQDYAGAVATARLVPAKSARGVEAKSLIDVSQAQMLMNPETASQRPVADQLSIFWAAMRAAQKLPANSPLAAQLQSYIPAWEQQLRDLTRLQIAQSLAKTGQAYLLQLAIQEAQEIQPDHIQRLNAQNLIGMWRQELLRIVDRPALERAQKLAQGGTATDLRAAIAEAKQIPKGRPLRSEAQAQIARWNRQLKALDDQPILKQAQLLAKQQKYTEAIQVVSQIGPDRPLYAQAQSAIASWNTKIQLQEQRAVLKEANSYAAARNYAVAIDLAASIPPESSLYLEAQTAIAIWSTGQPYKALMDTGSTALP